MENEDAFKAFRRAVQNAHHKEDPMFIPIQSPPFSRIPLNEETPPRPHFLHLVLVLNYRDVLKILTFLLVMLSLIPLIMRFRKRLRHERMYKVRKAIQTIFAFLNVIWIIGCVCLLIMSAHIFLSNYQDKVERIEKTFPWYIITIILCCIIEIVESIFGLSEPVITVLSTEKTVIDLKHGNKCSPLTRADGNNNGCNKKADDEKLLLA
uniref:Uncharacterized protein n=1 Tax=Clytia hemisphaerica TaxID=252671 RepID=A0A7M5X363_9CNID|eukprot:TCONS_00005991-protein